MNWRKWALALLIGLAVGWFFCRLLPPHGSGGGDGGFIGDALADVGGPDADPADTDPADTNPGDGSSTGVDAGGPGRTPGCGNCDFNPATGNLTAVFQQRVTTYYPEPATPQYVLGLHLTFSGGGTQVLPLKLGENPEIVANCSTSKTFAFNTADMGTGTITKVQVVVGATGSGQWFRGCVKRNGAILDANCVCCACASCIGTCAP